MIDDLLHLCYVGMWLSTPFMIGVIVGRETSNTDPYAISVGRAVLDAEKTLTDYRKFVGDGFELIQQLQVKRRDGALMDVRVHLADTQPTTPQT